jgi:hypothetical protein
MASQLVIPTADPAIDSIIDAPLDPDLLDKLVQSLPSIKNPALAYAWAKRGVQRFARREAMIWGPQGGRVCSIRRGWWPLLWALKRRPRTPRWPPCAT